MKYISDSFSLQIFSANLIPWTASYNEGSLHNAIHRRALAIADLVGGDVEDMQDDHGNFLAVVKGRGYYMEFWDE